jgi:hypothetical protein
MFMHPIALFIIQDDEEINICTKPDELYILGTLAALETVVPKISIFLLHTYKGDLLLIA